MEIDKDLSKRRHEFYMNIAINEARNAGMRDEVPVGACIVDPTGQTISSAGNQTIERNDPTAHAEILAVRFACEKIGNYRLTEYTLYTTIEPCVMCAGALVGARIKRLIYGAADKRFGAANSAFSLCDNRSLNHQMKVIPGVLATRCSALMSDFFSQKRNS